MEDYTIPGLQNTNLSQSELDIDAIFLHQYYQRVYQQLWDSVQE